ncbi:MAG: DUF5678 domain-containing protein [Blastocatellia bacterium]
MSLPGYEQFREQILHLPPELVRLVKSALRLTADEQQRLLAELDRDPAAISHEPDYVRELKWLRENRHLYRGQHVAISGDKLIAHDADLSELYRKIDAAGAGRVLTAWIEPEDFSSAGWGA